MADPAHFAILGVAKLKTRAQLVARASHHLREHAVPNADKTRTPKNVTTWSGTARELADAVLDRTAPLVKRKDAVRSVEVMLGASPEWHKRHGGKGDPNDLVKAGRKWLADTFGKANVVAFGYHHDERSPHLWAIVTPIAKDPAGKPKLAASHWLDGPKAIAALHTSWAKATAPLGLVRGSERSLGKRVDLRTYYAASNGSAAAAAKIEREMSSRRRRAVNAEAEAKKAAEDLEARELEMGAREAKLAAGEAKLRQAQRDLGEQQAAMRRAWEAMEPAAKIVAANRMAELERRDERKAPKPR